MIIQCAEDLVELCSSATPEGLHLEYKRKADPTTPKLDKGDKRSIAEAIVSFANSDGGTLIFGVESEKRDGLDVAVSPSPISEVEKFVGQMRLVAELNVSPQVRGLVIEAIPSGDGSGAGFAICRVPSSEQRPHMSTAPDVHRYYRRSFTGSSLMTPSEIRDQILATREAVLEPIIQTGGGSGFLRKPSWIGIGSDISFALRNIGSRLCREPYLRVSASCDLTSHSYRFDTRLNAWKTEYPTGTLIHVDDQIHCITLYYLARFDIEALLNDGKHTVGSLLNSVTILPGNDMHSDASFVGDGLDAIELMVAFGAENATARTSVITITRDEFAQRILADCSGAFRDMLINEALSGWPQYLFDEIRQLRQR